MGLFSSLLKKDDKKRESAVNAEVQSSVGYCDDFTIIALIAAAIYASPDNAVLGSTLIRKASGFPPVWSMSGRQVLMYSRQKTKGVKK